MINFCGSPHNGIAQFHTDVILNPNKEALDGDDWVNAIPDGTREEDAAEIKFKNTLDKRH